MPLLDCSYLACSGRETLMSVMILLLGFSWASNVETRQRTRPTVATMVGYKYSHFAFYCLNHWFVKIFRNMFCIFPIPAPHCTAVATTTGWMELTANIPLLQFWVKHFRLKIIGKTHSVFPQNLIKTLNLIKTIALRFLTVRGEEKNF